MGQPEGYIEALGGLPAATSLEKRLSANFDLIQYFSASRSRLEAVIENLKRHMKSDGMLWLCWPKQSSGMTTDLDENVVRSIGLKHGLVDVKVAAIDETWSGLKFVYRLSDRNR